MTKQMCTALDAVAAVVVAVASSHVTNRSGHRLLDGPARANLAHLAMVSSPIVDGRMPASLVHGTADLSRVPAGRLLALSPHAFRHCIKFLAYEAGGDAVCFWHGNV